MPSRGQCFPFRGQRFPSRGQRLPSRGQRLPSKGQRLPSRGQRLPSGGRSPRARPPSWLGRSSQITEKEGLRAILPPEPGVDVTGRSASPRPSLLVGRVPRPVPHGCQPLGNRPPPVGGCTARVGSDGARARDGRRACMWSSLARTGYVPSPQPLGRSLSFAFLPAPLPRGTVLDENLQGTGSRVGPLREVAEGCLPAPVGAKVGGLGREPQGPGSITNP